MTKICNKCNIEKEIYLFHKNKGTLDGYLGHCKECNKVYVQFLKHLKMGIVQKPILIEKVCPKCKILKKLSDFDRSFTKSNGYSSYCKICMYYINKERNKTQKRKEQHKKYNKKRREIGTEERNKQNCRDITRYAIQIGKLIKEPCIKCGSKEKIQPHHTDYNKPLEVEWLCNLHHLETHGKKPIMLEENQ